MTGVDFELPTSLAGGFDPFADEVAAPGPTAGEKKSKSSKPDAEGFAVHVRMQQRNGRKSLTTVQGLPEAFDYKKILKALKKEYCCNGTVIEDEELGKVLQLQGDQRKNVSAFLLGNELCKKDQIKVHGS
ncbi:hypothetical protein CHLNCDRAFT_133842 [Chlorella variabilis]|uniref:SUI1 domain-containing protein n=1 Tax=Chlorella variabilis TaxID=554065 RepID=E1ZFC9_CHLVA|nr:hypothetical protein CHLNCDRAFT_133842 [Chlorella variabilis]EFN55481.1 hypothetical protein CHLNCDRAFT_133842 [Chlorella variabilis]|eukprot:XP_005847583.1 hypothetical protein CHLNCDRAFT_133842 [Chlorella variabilis]